MSMHWCPTRGLTLPVSMLSGDSVSGRFRVWLADGECRTGARALRSWVPRGVSAWMYTSLEVCSPMFAGLECKRKAVVAILARISMEFAVWAAAHSTDGRVPLKIGGSRFDRQFSHRLRHLSAAFSAFFFWVTKPGVFPINRSFVTSYRYLNSSPS